jgi:hypothetical protein
MENFLLKSRSFQSTEAHSPYPLRVLIGFHRDYSNPPRRFTKGYSRHQADPNGYAPHI